MRWRLLSLNRASQLINRLVMKVGYTIEATKGSLFIMSNIQSKILNLQGRDSLFVLQMVSFWPDFRYEDRKYYFLTLKFACNCYFIGKACNASTNAAMDFYFPPGVFPAQPQQRRARGQGRQRQQLQQQPQQQEEEETELI